MLIAVKTKGTPARALHLDCRRSSLARERKAHLKRSLAHPEVLGEQRASLYTQEGCQVKGIKRAQGNIGMEVAHQFRGILDKKVAQ